MKKLLPYLFVFASFFVSAQSETQTYVPDDNFEQALIDLGYDDVLDDYVLTSNIKDIFELFIEEGSIADLTGLEDMTNLHNLLLPKGTFSSVDFSGNPNLELLGISSDNLNFIDFSNNPRLEFMTISNSGLKSIDLSNNPKLAIANLNGNHLETLDLSNSTQLVIVDVSDNNLSSLNLKNGANTSLTEMNATNNTALSCIQVDDVAIATSKDWFKDDTASYSIDCFPADQDNDGVNDSIDLCPNTPTGEQANASGCSASQLADLAVQNICIGMGSDPCSDTPNCYVNIGVLQDVEINVTIVKNDTEQLFDGPVSMANPLFLENLTEGEYRICASHPGIPGFEQCYEVSSSATENNVNTTIVMQNAGQEYTITAAGSKSYEVRVNDNTYTYNFGTYDAQQITFPLVAGVNAITVTGRLDCSENERITFVPDNNFEQALIDLGYDDVLDDYVVTVNISDLKELDLSNMSIENLQGIGAFTALEDFNCHFNPLTELDLSKNTRLKYLDVSDLFSLTAIDLTNNIDLETLDVTGTSIEVLDVSRNVNLHTLFALVTSLNQIDLSQNSTLEILYLQTEQITNIDFTNNPLLKELRIRAYQNTGINVSNNPLLENLYLFSDEIAELDLTNNPNLKNLTIATDGEGIMTVDLTNNTKLKFVNIFGNLTDIDLSQNSELTSLHLSDNALTALDLTANTSLEILGTTGNPLSCIQVADVEAANRMQIIDIGEAEFSTNCNYSDSEGVSETEIESTGKIITYPTLTTGKITIDNPNQEQIATVSVAAMNGKRISLLPIYDNPSEVHLDISGNGKGMYIIRVAKMTGKNEYIKVILE